MNTDRRHLGFNVRLYNVKTSFIIFTEIIFINHRLLFYMKTLFLILAGLLCGTIVFPQDTLQESKSPKPLKDKLFYGGTIGLSFGSYSRVAVYPNIGIRVSPKFRTGLQLGYEYISDDRGDIRYTASNYGVSIFAQYNVIPALYIHVEPAFYNYDAYYVSGENRVWVPFIFAGAGLHQRLGRRSVIFVQVKFDLLQDSNSPYKNWDPFFDIGVAVGI
jgi:hypothetical protein